MLPGKKRIFGIFGSMLIFYIICFITGMLEIILQSLVKLLWLVRKSVQFASSSLQ